MNIPKESFLKKKNINNFNKYFVYLNAVIDYNYFIRLKILIKRDLPFLSIEVGYAIVK